VAKQDDRLYFAANGHSLTGVKRRGKWKFICDSWPALAVQHEGAADYEAILTEFAWRALKGEAEIRASLGTNDGE
jgi:hypothetical protein